jgi:hypothetical protein
VRADLLDERGEDDEEECSRERADEVGPAPLRGRAERGDEQDDADRADRPEARREERRGCERGEESGCGRGALGAVP